MDVIIETSGFSITLVESNLPPSPTSRITISQAFSLKYKNPAAVKISNSVSSILFFLSSSTILFIMVSKSKSLIGHLFTVILSV